MSKPATTEREREVFRYVAPDERHIRVVASGLIDDAACEMMEWFIRLQRAHLAKSHSCPHCGESLRPSANEGGAIVCPNHCHERLRDGDGLSPEALGRLEAMNG